MKKNYYGNGFNNNTRNNTPRHASRRDTLANAGINSDQYLSMRIDKEFIPDGAEIVIQVRDKETGEVHYVPFNQAMDDCFGKNSQFYKQEMSDGHIFNPYIHRRWLPAQFRRNIREAGYNGIYDYVKRCYNWNYVVRFLKQECWKLAMLQRRDPEAFRERSVFFKLDDMRVILGEYVLVIKNMLSEAERNLERNNSYCARNNQQTHIYIYGMGMVKKEHIRPIRYRYDRFLDAVNRAYSYADLSRLLNDFEFDKAERNIPSTERFAHCFIESGAFYTLKQMIMFEGLSLGGRNVKEDLDLLKERGRTSYMSLYSRLGV